MSTSTTRFPADSRRKAIKEDPSSSPLPFPHVEINETTDVGLEEGDQVVDEVRLQGHGRHLADNQLNPNPLLPQQGHPGLAGPSYGP